MNILVLSNIPSPYRIDFFNELGKKVNLTVVFEAKTAPGIHFNWNLDEIKSFEAIFLNDGDINEKQINWNILKYIKEYKYDIIIVTSYAYFTEMISLIALKIKKTPYYLEVDGGLIRNENRFKKALKSFLISNAEGYFSPSKLTDDYLVHYGAEREKIYRYHFTSLSNKDIQTNVVSKEEKLKIRQELNIREERIVLAVGQFIYRKGFDVLLNASRLLESSIGIYFVGGNPTEEYLNIRNNYKLENIHFAGFKSKDELAKFYKAANLFVLPTREDVWGLVINEAMGFGLPVITTDRCVAGLELIKDNINGFIVPTEDPKSLAVKINEVLVNEDLRESMSQNNIEKIKDYTIEKMAEKHIKIFD